METLKKNKILLGVLAVTVLIFIYYFTSSGSSETPVVTTTDTVSSSAGNDIASLFQQLGAAAIDTKLFASPAWTSLNDISSPIANDPKGKADLFAPIGQSGQAAGQVGTTTQR